MRYVIIRGFPTVAHELAPSFQTYCGSIISSAWGRIRRDIPTYARLCDNCKGLKARGN